MAQLLDIPLPEVTAESFKRAWTRFELVAKAKEWEAAKQLTVLPTLLRGKLVEKNVDFDDETKGDIDKLKAALQKASGQTEDPLGAARAFVARDQLPPESVEDFAAALKTIFKQAYPGEATSSTVLLQRFLTGLRASISQQVLLRKKPENLTEAIAIAAEVEYALSFDGGRKKKADAVNLLQRPSQDHEQPQQANQLSRLQSSLDEMTK